jgi:hypothetical protein
VWLDPLQSRTSKENTIIAAVDLPLEPETTTTTRRLCPGSGATVWAKANRNVHCPRCNRMTQIHGGGDGVGFMPIVGHDTNGKPWDA